MILFNLLPHRDIKEQHERRIFYAYVAIAVIVSVILSWSANEVISFYTERQKEKVEFLKSKIDSLGSNTKFIIDLKSKIKTILDNHKVISKINYDKLNMLTMIKEVSTVVPYGVYLRSFDTTSSTNIHISGVAVSNKSVADFLNNLAKSKVFDTVNLIHTKIMYTKFGIFQDFKIVVTVKMSHNSGVSDKVYDAFGEAKNKLVRAIGPSPMGPSPTLNG